MIYRRLYSRIVMGETPIKEIKMNPDPSSEEIIEKIEKAREQLFKFCQANDINFPIFYAVCRTTVEFVSDTMPELAGSIDFDKSRSYLDS